MKKNINPLNLVESFQKAVNQHHVDKVITMFTEDAEFEIVWQKFLPWLSENYPDKYSTMFTSEGRFIYNRENGARIVPMLRKWREEQEIK